MPVRTDFNTYFPGQDEHASFYTDDSSHNGSIYQEGIAARAGEEFKLILADTRIEENANADFQFGLEFWGTGKVGEVFVQLPMPGSLIEHGEHSMMATAPAGTQFVLPVFKFDNVVSVTGLQENIFIFEASLKRVAVETGDFDGDGDVDGNDFLMWQRGETSPPLSASALAAWKANYGNTSPLSVASSTVPEPSSLGLGLMVLGLRVSFPKRGI